MGAAMGRVSRPSSRVRIGGVWITLCLTTVAGGRRRRRDERVGRRGEDERALHRLAACAVQKRRVMRAAVEVQLAVRPYCSRSAGGGPSRALVAASRAGG